jgi:hypothetical protein
VPNTKRDRSGEYQRLKQRCLQLNICFKCRKPKETDKWLCNLCLERTRIIDSRRSAKKKAAGLCKCGALPQSGFAYCTACLQYGKDYQAQRRNHHLTIGGCITCGNQPIPGCVTCVDCAKRATDATLKRYRNNVLNNVCPFCAGEVDNYFRCQQCHTAHLTRGRIRWHLQRSIVLNHYGNKCMCCGESDIHFLEIDHIHNNGCDHRKITGRHVYEWIIKHQFSPDLQLLCANCNRGKSKFSLCPHCREPTLPKSHKSRRLRKRRQSIIAHYGGVCNCCHENNWAFLEFDHINNDGNVHRKSIGANPNKLMQWIITNNYPDTIQLHCSNCNKAKGLYGPCPHQRSLVNIAQS